MDEVIETIPDWVTYWNPKECEIAFNKNKGWCVFSHELQITLAHSQSKQALIDWLG